MDKLISKKKTYLKNNFCGNSSTQKDKNKNYSESKKKSNLHFGFHCNPTPNYSVLIFTIFSIILPIGTQPILQTNLAFAQSDLSSPSSDPKSPIDSRDPFDFSGKNMKKAIEENIIIPDIVGPDGELDIGSSSTMSPKSESQSQSIAQPAYNINNNNPHNDEIIETNDKRGTELTSSNSQMDLQNSNNINNNTNEESIQEVIESDDQSSYTQSEPTTSHQSQSQSIAQPAYNIDNNPHNDEIIETNDKRGTELTSSNSQMDLQNSNNINNNTNEESIQEVIESDDQSSYTQSEPTTSHQSQSQSQSQSNAQLNYYKSYRDYMEKNNQVANADINGTGNNLGAESSSNSQMDTDNSNININKNTNEIDIIVPDDKLSSNDESSTDDELSSSLTSSSELSAQASNEVYGDFNGDGFDDLAIGVPHEDVDIGALTIEDAGAVNVLYGSSNGLSATSPRPDQIWTQSSPDVNDVSEVNDRFGESLSAGDFNGDGFDDLAIAGEFEDVDTGAGTIVDAGAVNVLYGSSNGLSATSPRPDQIWTQSSPDVNDVSEDSDQFGQSISAADFNGDGIDDLAIGVVGEDVDSGAGAINSAGAVNVLYGSSNGLSATSPRPDQIWTQNSPDVNDVSEASDFFGVTVSAADFNGDGIDDLAIGVDAEDVDSATGTIENAGAVNVLYGSSNGLSATSPRPDQIWTQNSPDVNDVSEDEDRFGSSLSAADFNGDGIDDLAIGVRGEATDITHFLEGAVNILYGSSNGLSATSPRPDQIWTQNSPDVNDVSEDEDRFGDAVSTGDFNGDGIGDLAIGVPGEDVDSATGTIENAGAVNVLYGSSNGLSATSPRPDQIWTQNSPDVNDVSETSDFLGSSLSGADFNGDGLDDMVMAGGDEDVDSATGTIENAGAVNVLYGSSNGLSATSPRPDQIWTQNSPDVNDVSEDQDFFGTSLS